MHRHRQLLPNSSSFPTSSIPVQANKPAFWFHFFWQHIYIAFSIGKSSDQTSIITWHSGIYPVSRNAHITKKTSATIWY